MKKNYFLLFVVSCALINCKVQAQAFRKGSLLVSVSEGQTFGNYSTGDISTTKPTLIKRECINGTRDPLIVEYGISNRWSIGLTSGADIYNINPSQFYHFSGSSKLIKSTTAEVTLDGSYHFFVNKRLDLSMVTSIGAFSVTMQGKQGDASYKYTANGNIIRTGIRARYYFFKRLGAFGMLSSYAATCSPKDVKGNTVATKYSTSINGFASEIGLCFRILR